MKVLELFGGIGACSKALSNLNIEHTIVDYVEIDKYAVKSFNAIHRTNFEPQDIRTYDKNIEADLIMHGSPCQDFSLAGKQAGGDKDSGTRSSLLYETIRIVAKVKPKYVIWENVKNVISKKHRHNFDDYLEEMSKLGYTNYYQVLNAKDYGIPQNRERVFTISILGEHDIFNFPQKQELKLKLKDMLEDEVDEKYYLNDVSINKIQNSNFMQERKRIQEKDCCDTLLSRDYKDPKCIQVGNLDIKGQDIIKRVYSNEGLSPALTTMEGGNRQPKIQIKEATKQGYKEAYIGDGINISSRMEYQRGNVQKESIQTLTTSGGSDRGVVLNDFRIRKLTPKECWRLMGFSDEDFNKASQVNSNSQLYKQAGNSIVVNVLMAIFKELMGE